MLKYNNKIDHKLYKPTNGELNRQVRCRAASFSTDLDTIITINDYYVYYYYCFYYYYY